MGHSIRLFLTMMICTFIVYLGFLNGNALAIVCTLIIGALSCALLLLPYKVTVEQVFYEADLIENTVSEEVKDEK